MPGSAPQGGTRGRSPGAAGRTDAPAGRIKNAGAPPRTVRKDETFPTPKRGGASCVIRDHAKNSAALWAGSEGKMNLKDKVLGFALRAAGSAGVAFKEFARWLSPFGWTRRDLTPVLRGMREEGLTELTEDPEGEILDVRLTERGERKMAETASR